MTEPEVSAIPSFVPATSPQYELAPTKHDVVIYPSEIRDGVGLYRGELLALKKQFEEAGIDAAYAHDSEQRKWIGLNGEAVLVPVIICLSTGLSVSAFVELLKSRFGKTPVRVKVTRSIAADGASTEWFEAEGTGGDVAAALHEFRGDGRSDP